MDPDNLRKLSLEPCFWKEEATGNTFEVVKYALAVAASEREECAKLCEITASAVLLLSGEMTRQELRTVMAVLRSRATAIRQRGRL